MSEAIITVQNLPKELLDEQLEELVAPGYGPMEIGYRTFSGGVMTAIYSRMPNCKGAMMDWWFGSYLEDNFAYKLWSPDHDSLRWENKQPGSYVGATEVNGEFGVVRRSLFRDPAEIFDVSKFPESNITSALYVEVQHTGVPGRGTITLQTIRDTYDGCELRARYFQIGGTPQGAQKSIRHSVNEYADLSLFLPMLYRRRNEP